MFRSRSASKPQVSKVLFKEELLIPFIKLLAHFVKIDINFILKKINELCQIKDEGSIIIEDYYHPTAFYQFQ